MSYDSFCVDRRTEGREVVLERNLYTNRGPRGDKLFLSVSQHETVGLHSVQWRELYIVQNKCQEATKESWSTNSPPHLRIFVNLLLLILIRQTRQLKVF